MNEQKPPSDATKNTIGYKQNNPGNLTDTSDVFNGEIQSTNRFVNFSGMMWGYRALAVVLFNKVKAGENTIRKIISSFAPPTENNTVKYIADMAHMTGINADQVLTQDSFKGNLLVEPDMKKIARAISTIEIGWVDETNLTRGYNRFKIDRLIV